MLDVEVVDNLYFYFYFYLFIYLFLILRWVSEFGVCLVCYNC